MMRVIAPQVVTKMQVTGSPCNCSDGSLVAGVADVQTIHRGPAVTRATAVRPIAPSVISSVARPTEIPLLVSAAVCSIGHSPAR